MLRVKLSLIILSMKNNAILEGNLLQERLELWLV